MTVEVAPPVSSATSPSEQLDEFVDDTSSGFPSEGGALPEIQQLEAATPPIPELSPQDDADFLLHPVELAKGRRAAENYLGTFRSDDSRKAAEEALETLATVISGGEPKPRPLRLESPARPARRPRHRAAERSATASSAPWSRPAPPTATPRATGTPCSSHSSIAD